MRRAALIAALLLAIFACAPRPMDRSRWMNAPQSERVLYVEALLGAERAKQAKGGNDRSFSRPPAAYVEEIDRAYARGDQRRANEIFESLADR